MSAVDELAVGDGWPGGGSPEQEVGKIGDAPAADPPGCNCVYLGMQQNWDAYQQQLAARQMAKEEISAAESQAEWDFGAWGW